MVLRLGPDDDPRAVADTLRRAEGDRIGDPTVSVGLGGPRDPERPGFPLPMARNGTPAITPTFTVGGGGVGAQVTYTGEIDW